jgi:hypothetical protein
MTIDECARAAGRKRIPTIRNEEYARLKQGARAQSDRGGARRSCDEKTEDGKVNRHGEVDDTPKKGR